MSDGRDTDAERAGVFIRYVVWYLTLHVTFDHGILCEAAILFLYGIHTVREPSDTITKLEVLGDLVSNLYDSAHVITADGAAFSLSGKGGIVDVLPVEVSACTC